MKIAHLSDLHYFKLDLSLKNIFSKNLLASLNYLFNRKHHKALFEINDIPQLLKKLGVTHVIVTGDFTTTSSEQEYQLAKSFTDELTNLGMKVIAVPGNHDTYNFAAQRQKRFYQYLPASKDLKEQSIDCGDLGNGIKYIQLDTSLATPLWSSQGLFSKSLEEKLKAKLKMFGTSQPIIVINHFPTTTRKKTSWRHRMKRYNVLHRILADHPNVLIYLCGHTHLSEMIEEKPLILNSGSLTLTKHGSFHVMELSKEKVDVQAFCFDKTGWVVDREKTFLF